MGIYATSSPEVRIGNVRVRHYYQIALKQKSISRYEAGKPFPKIETLTRLAKVLKKSLGYFLDKLGVGYFSAL